MAIDPILLEQSTLVMTETFAVFLTLLVLGQFAAPRFSYVQAGAGGFALGLAALARPVFLPLGVAAHRSRGPGNRPRPVSGQSLATDSAPRRGRAASQRFLLVGVWGAAVLGRRATLDASQSASPGAIASHHHARGLYAPAGEQPQVSTSTCERRPGAAYGTPPNSIGSE